MSDMPANKAPNRWALVCGASQGIGRAVAQTLSRDGYNIIALARNEDALKSLQSELKTKCEILAVDVLDRTKLESEIQKVQNKLGTISVLVLNSGGPASGPIVDAKEEQFLKAFEQHLFASALLARLLIPGMRAQKFGRIVNILSTSVKIPLPNLGVSNTMRWAVAAWSKTLSLEVAKDGITVNNVLPGYTQTTRLQTLAEGAAKNQNRSVESVYNDWRKTIPMDRFGEPSEIAEVAAFLASTKASYVNGVSIPVDGGRTGAI